MSEYFAHSPKDGVPAQSYKDHVNSVLTHAKQYAKELRRYGKQDGKLLASLAMASAEFHDLGKLDKDNQRVLSGDQKARKLPKNHVDAGCAHFLDEKNSSLIAAVIIASHHKGLPCFIAEENKGESAFRDERIMQEVNNSLSDFEQIHNRLVQTELTCTDEIPKGNLSVFLRLLLSCLADADHTNTGDHYEKRHLKQNAVPLRPADRLASLDRYVSSFGTPSSERNALRAEMYAACKSTVTESTIASCDSPVGSGKTTAVMAHLLAQAQKRSLRRIFVVLPFTNIIEQSVDIYRKALVLPGENPNDVVAELHHRADFESLDARHLTALWRAPIIVTTAVAFFETLASNLPSALRRLHELPGSAIFIDEAHAALPSKLLPIAWRWLNSYADDWSCYWLLASGSLSRFWEIEEISPQKAIVPEIVSDSLRTSLARFEQARVTHKCDLLPKQIDEFTNWVSKYPGPRLVIVNTVQTAAVLAKFFSDKFGGDYVEHLSTALTPNDRERTLDRVKSRLEKTRDRKFDNDNWTLIATSCVEAGIDLSFRIGFRELASLTSLLQASGRVNRNGEEPSAEVWTFCLAETETLKSNPGIENAASVLREYMRNGTVISPKLTTSAIEKEIKLYGIDGVHKKLVEGEELQCFPLVAEKFRVIESDTRIAVIDDNVAKKIRNGNIDQRELQKNSIRIASYKLQETNAPLLLDGIYHWNFGYNNFIGYMEGVIKMNDFKGEVLII